MPRARVTMATAVKPGVFASRREVWRRSRSRAAFTGTSCARSRCGHPARPCNRWGYGLGQEADPPTYVFCNDVIPWELRGGVGQGCDCKAVRESLRRRFKRHASAFHPTPTHAAPPKGTLPRWGSQTSPQRTQRLGKMLHVKCSGRRRSPAHGECGDHLGAPAAFAVEVRASRSSPRTSVSGPANSTRSPKTGLRNHASMGEARWEG
jgi:hypothetical protein